MTAAAATGVAAPERGRIAAIDVARGVALIGMFAYHLCWDLAFFRFIDGDVPLATPSRIFAHVVASLFLLLVGIGLVLAARGRIVWPAYFERLVWIGAAAAAVSLATWFLFPTDFIYFGILHCILVASLVALPFVRLPVWLAAGVAAACFGAPLLASPAFDHPALWWLGLGTNPPPTFDYRPVFPWTGVVLVGIVAARLALPRAANAAWTRWSPRTMAGRTVAWAGRHSLLVYMGHQPAFLGVLSLVFLVLGPSAQVERQPFERSCQKQCVGAGAKSAVCEAACACVVERSKREGLWPKVLAGGLSADERLRFSHFGGDCLRGAPSAEPPRH